MATKCVACGVGDSVSVDENGIPPLCDSCWARAGENVGPGNRVVCTVSHPDCSGVVRALDDGYIAIVDTLDGGTAHIPVAELVAA